MQSIFDNSASLLGAFIAAFVVTRLTYLFVRNTVVSTAKQSITGFVVGMIICIIMPALWYNYVAFILLFILDVSGVTHKSPKTKEQTNIKSD